MGGTSTERVPATDDALPHLSRFQLVHHVAVDDGGILCGAKAPACEDG